MADKAFGSICVREGKYQNKVVQIEAMKDSKHTSIMIHTYGGNRPGNRIRKRRINGHLQPITYSYRCEQYYSARHAVDDNNNVRQGSLSLEEAWGTKKWEMRQLVFVIALAETNALLAYNNYIQKKEGHPPLSLIDFRRLIVKEIIAMKEIRDKASQKEAKAPMTRRRSAHTLVTKPKYANFFEQGRWTLSKKKYKQCQCTGDGCQSMIRTHCTCDETKHLCSQCFALHVQSIHQD
jgi:hypothetical protein